MEAIKTLPWATLSDLKGNQQLLKQLEEAEAFIASMAQNSDQLGPVHIPDSKRGKSGPSQITRFCAQSKDKTTPSKATGCQECKHRSKAASKWRYVNCVGINVLNYRSIMVIPIRYIQRLDPDTPKTRTPHWNYWGFLRVDCNTRNVFDPRLSPELGGMFAALFSLYLRRRLSLRTRPRGQPRKARPPARHYSCLPERKH